MRTCANPLLSPDELRAALAEACKAAGGQKAWAALHGVSAPYVCDVLAGRREPGPTILEPLGFVRVTHYQRAAI